MQSFITGTVASLGGSAFQGLGGKFAKSMAGGVSFSALSGGVASELSGGNFWKGAGVGATIGLLNHYGKQLQQRLERPGKVNLKKNPVRGLKRWMRYIHRYKGVDPLSHRAFNLSDMVDADTVPKKYWFNDWFSDMITNKVHGTSKINGKYIRWNIIDRDISPGNENNINFISGDKVVGQNNVNTYWRINAFRSSNELIFNLVFYDYETYKEYSDYIFN